MTILINLALLAGGGVDFRMEQLGQKGIEQPVSALYDNDMVASKPQTGSTPQWWQGLTADEIEMIRQRRSGILNTAPENPDDRPVLRYGDKAIYDKPTATYDRPVRKGQQGQQ